MKNAIIYYYNINPSNIHQTKKEISFQNNNMIYNLVLTNISLEKIQEKYEISRFLNNLRVPVHQIIANKNGTLITRINEKNYVLLLIYINSNEKLMIKDLLKINTIKIGNGEKNNWYNLWTKKVDYFEYQLENIERKYPIIREISNYYIGLSENAIALLNNVNYYSNCVCHVRVSNETSLKEFYNPLNLIIDSRVRDISEFIKNSFFNLNLTNDEIILILKIYIKKNNLTVDECILFLSRMIYPTYYFDMYEKIIQNQLEEKAILKIVNKANEYEKLLKQINLYLKLNINFPEIEWL